MQIVFKTTGTDPEPCNHCLSYNTDMCITFKFNSKFFSVVRQYILLYYKRHIYYGIIKHYLKTDVNLTLNTLNTHKVNCNLLL